MASTAEANAPTQDAKASSRRGPEPQEEAENAQPPKMHSRGSDDNSITQKDQNIPDDQREKDDQREEGEVDASPPLPEDEQPPPLPVGEDPPPLPDESPEDDGWEPVWDDAQQAYYFYNRLTGKTQWENPRISERKNASAEHATVPVPARVHGGYNPAIHGDYDPNADYALEARAQEQAAAAVAAGGAPGQVQVPDYSATGTFNRFTGRWQAADQNPERHGDEAKTKRQMNAYFDVDAAANSHGGKSLKAERQNQKLSKSELKAFKEKRREKKEEKRRAWLRD